MTYRKATYEEYCKASQFAKIRYRFGVYIQLVAAILLLYLLFYTITNIEEMKANPIDYAEEKLGVNCFYPIGYTELPMNFTIEVENGSRRNT